MIMSVVSDIGTLSSLENDSLHAQLGLFSVINAMQCFAFFWRIATIVRQCTT